MKLANQTLENKYIATRLDIESISDEMVNKINKIAYLLIYKLQEHLIDLVNMNQIVMILILNH